MKKLKQLISLFFVTLFLCSKVAGLHVLTHDTNDTDVQHCEFCGLASVISFTPLLSADDEAPSQIKILFSELKLKSATAQIVFYNKPLESSCFTRPPPQFS